MVEQKLMTFGKLMPVLIAEINMFSSEMQALMRAKAQVYALVSKTHFFDENQTVLVKDIHDVKIPRQIAMYGQLRTNIDKIERIFAIFDRAKRRGSSEDIASYDFVNTVLSEVTKLVKKGVFHKNIISILNGQNTALKKRKFKEFCAKCDEEILLLQKIAKSLGKDELLAEFKNFRNNKVILNKRRLILCGCLIATLTAAGGSFISAVIREYKDYAKYPSYFTKIKDSLVPLGGLISDYEKNDLQIETMTEIRFERALGVNIIGSYSTEDLRRVLETIENTYKTDFFKRLGITRFIFISNKVMRNYRELGGFCSSKGEILLKTPIDEDRERRDSYSGKKTKFDGTTFHEVVHAVNYFILQNKPDLNNQWNNIKGGNLKMTMMREDNDTFEQIANSVSYTMWYAEQIEEQTLRSRERYPADSEEVINADVKAILFHSIRPGEQIRTPDFIETVDGNKQALQERIRLLLDNGFFPDNVKEKIKKYLLDTTNFL